MYLNRYGGFRLLDLAIRARDAVTRLRFISRRTRRTSDPESYRNTT